MPVRHRDWIVSLLAAALVLTAAGSAATDSAVISIGQVQGDATHSALQGHRVSVEGIVGATFDAGLDGFFLQSAAGTDDSDPASSDGIFVPHASDAQPAIRAGDRLRVTGTVTELGDAPATLTALTAARIVVLGRGEAPLLRVRAAPAEAADWERYEGMRVRVDAPLTVSGNDGLTRFGELLVSFDGRLPVPTERAAPGTAATRIAADNARRRLRLDDGASTDAGAARTLWYLPQPLAAAHPLRAGSTLHGVEGIVDQRHGRGDDPGYRLQLTRPLTAITQAPRPAAPQVAGDLRIAGLNLLNLFNGDGRGHGFPTARGAASADAFARQTAKLVATVAALRPDIAALMEVENDGFGPRSALAQFVAALNRADGGDDWRYVRVGSGRAARGPGSDAIRVALIYRGSRVRPVGPAATLGGGPFVSHSRMPLAQAFAALGGGPRFVVAVNHFKSKGSCQDALAPGDRDSGDGQGCWTATRIESARRLSAWLATDPTASGSDMTLIVGDLNAYTQEDPLRLLRRQGWRDAFAVEPGAAAGDDYSFVYAGQAGRLDHALLSPALAARLRGAVHWHSNADEAAVFEYGHDHASGPWRASDHDPLLLGLDLAR